MHAKEHVKSFYKSIVLKANLSQGTKWAEDLNRYFTHKKNMSRLGTVAHACNPSTLGG